ncbi:50S ribosomal protein L25 [Blochmannia endosymbiont of Camponotus (Colobopsis) obliquus]|uniref:50S ribosomal protein L25 n=1 Tax=Blochmannia endosymbiont of Camponotus (Colobopsis) obliquus TaxID=1505597 RepID=UPI00061A6116|nr:50S ribosomal protein L25 [Blochmannia endosymbiont of Camponotus (Colobopsis) obliquus]AKC60625.1 50S ribosomal protein L25 [Blochmannia endosymbiont of Camponotus (Colobopsis) obliquus]
MLTFHAVTRKKLGTQASRRLRLQKQYPAIIYGKNILPISISLNYNHYFNIQQIKKIYKEKMILIINQKNETMVKIQEVTYHPFKPIIMHIDFIRI